MIQADPIAITRARATNKKKHTRKTEVLSKK